MSDRAPYSRVYWSVMDDDKFDGIREDVRHFGAWSLLLIVADMAWPAPAFVPAAVPKASYRLLVEAELIDSLSGGRFRVHGLDAERGRRSSNASASATARWSHTERIPDGMQTHTERSPNGVLAETEPSTSQDEPRTSRDTARDPAGIYWTLTGKYPTGNSLSWIDQLTQAFGVEPVADELAKAFAEDPRVSTLIGRTQDRLRAGNRTAPSSKKPRVLEPWELEFRAKVQADYDREGPIVQDPKRESA